MKDFRHQMLSPEQIATPHRIENNDIRFGTQLMNGWLVDNTGETTQSLYPSVDCDGNTFWDSMTRGYMRYDFGGNAITELQLDALIEGSSNKEIPEPLTVVTHAGKLISLVGFDIWGMGQHQSVLFYRGDYVGPSVIGRLAVPEGFWFLRYAILR